ncbi:MAG: hypothetical protein AAF483_01905 [Planctomycetota bacterium]
MTILQQVRDARLTAVRPQVGPNFMLSSIQDAEQGRADSRSGGALESGKDRAVQGHGDSGLSQRP